MSREEQIQSLREALEKNLNGFVWEGEGLEEALRGLFPECRVAWVSARGRYIDLLERVSAHLKNTFLVWTDVETEDQMDLVQSAVAAGAYGGKNIIVGDPKLSQAKKSWADLLNPEIIGRKLCLVALHLKNKEETLPLANELLQEAKPRLTPQMLAGFSSREAIELFALCPDLFPKTRWQSSQARYLPEIQRHLRALREACAQERQRETFRLSRLLSWSKAQRNAEAYEDAFLSLQYAEEIAKSSPDSLAEVLVEQAKTYLEMGHPGCTVLVQQKIQALSRLVGEEHEGLRALRAGLSKPLEDFSRLIAETAYSIWRHGPLWGTLFLFIKVQPDLTSTIIETDGETLWINPYVFSQLTQAQRDSVLQRALLRTALLHIHEPTKPEHKAVLACCSGYGYVEPLPSWLTEMEQSTGRLFREAKRTQEEDHRYWRTAFSHTQLRKASPERYPELLQELRAKDLLSEEVLPSPVIEALLERVRPLQRAILRNQSGVQLPSGASERLLLMIDLLHEIDSVEMAASAFRWFIRNCSDEVIMAFGNGLMISMRERGLQGYLALAVKRDPELQQFLSAYQQRLGMGSP